MVAKSSRPDAKKDAINFRSRQFVVVITSVGLPKPLRLKHWQDFQATYQQGKRYRGTHLLLRVLREPHLAPSRFGIAVSQKVSKKAVVRNRIKRQLRAVLLCQCPHLASGFNVIIVVLPSAVLCKYEHFLRELEQLFKQAGIMNHGH